jgi:hypothetical protein
MHFAEPVHASTISSFSKCSHQHIWIAETGFWAEVRFCNHERSEAMKISSILRDLLASRIGYATESCASWTDDPYAHPDIDAMSERERADLPPTHMPARRAMGCPVS